MQGRTKHGLTIKKRKAYRKNPVLKDTYWIFRLKAISIIGQRITFCKHRIPELNMLVYKNHSIY